MTPALSVTRKEVVSYFSSPLAFIAVGAFLAAVLFTFFWVEAFFARGVADLRPLFAWLPLLVMLLVAALGMRQWSEEQRSGTLEILLTLPVRPFSLVLGKFLAIQVLVATALLLTLPLPLTVAMLGDLDPGPVVGGYLASLLMAGAYAALALFLSSRTSNQIVAFISTAVVGGALYLVGTPGVTDFAGGAGDLLRQIGTGSRFASIERGVLDLRDLVYYLSLTAGFLVACVLALDAKRWSRGAVTARYRRRALAAAALTAANLIVLNVWLGPFARLRVDLTADRAYSLSPATVSLLQDLAEPLLIRAYLSERTHPLLAPLAPQIGGLLEEYRIAGRGAVTAQVIDPGTDPQAEEEAAQRYSIRPTPFQVEDRFEQGIVNSYFDVLVSYGDQYEVLGFQDLIRIDRGRGATIEVRLRNFEYDLTRAIKKASSGFRSIDSLFAALRGAAGSGPAELALYVTPATLPADLNEPRATVVEAARALAERSGGALAFREVDPGPGGAAGRQELADRYGLQPISASLFSTETYYFDLILTSGDQAFIVRPKDEYSAASVTAAVEAALKRIAPGFLRTVGVSLPPAVPTQDPFGRPQQPFASWELLQQQLAGDYAVQDVDLNDGEVPPQVDALVVVAPQALSDRERFAVDQYLMRGGALLVAAGSHRADADPFTGGLTLSRAGQGMAALLESYGVGVASSVVMDPQNESFPTTVQSGSILQIRAVDYPYFVDVRRDGMSRTHPITSSLEAVTLNWASPLTVDGALAAGRQVDVLLRSTVEAWTVEQPSAQPDFDSFPNAGFAAGDDRQEWPLAVTVTGRFDSAFAASGPPGEDAADRRSMIDASPDDTRLVVFGSGEFLNDTIMSLSASLHGERYRNSLQALQNAVDWAVEDLDLLGIRSEGAVTRLLLPIDDAAERAWEVVNYVVVALLLAGVGIVWWMRRRGERPMYGPTADAPPEDRQPADRQPAGREAAP